MPLSKTLFLVSACNGMLETGRVGRVTCDGYVNALFVHDSNTFLNVVCSIAVNFSTKTFRIRFTEYFFYCRSVYGSYSVSTNVNPLIREIICSCVFSKTVQDNAKRFFTNFVCLLSNTDSTFCCGKGLMSCKESRNTLSLLPEAFYQGYHVQDLLYVYQQLNQEYKMPEVRSPIAAAASAARLQSFFDCNCCTYYICPASIFKTNWLNTFNLVIYIQTSVFRNLLCFFDRGDTIAQLNTPLILSILLSYDSNKAIILSSSIYLRTSSVLGSMILTASSTRPYCPQAFS